MVWRGSPRRETSQEIPKPDRSSISGKCPTPSRSTYLACGAILSRDRLSLLRCERHHSFPTARVGCIKAANTGRSRCPPRTSLDQRCQAEIAAVCKTFAGLPQEAFVPVRIAPSSAFDTRSSRRPPRPVHQFPTGIGFCEIAGGIDDLAGPDPLLIPIQRLHQNQMAHQFRMCGGHQRRRIHIGAGWAQHIRTALPSEIRSSTNACANEPTLKSKLGFGVENPKPGGSTRITRAHWVSRSNIGSWCSSALGPSAKKTTVGPREPPTRTRKLTVSVST